MTPDLDAALGQFFGYLGGPDFMLGLLGLAIAGYIIKAVIRHFLWTSN